MPATKVVSTWVTGNLTFKEVSNGNGGQVIFGHTNGGLDVVFRGTTSSCYSMWDESANGWVNDGVDFKLNDNDYLKLGDSTDASLCWDSAKLALTAATASTFQLGSSGTNINTRFVGTLIVGTTGKSTGKDVTIYGTTATNAIKFTAASNRLQLDGIALTGTSTASEALSIQAWGTAASTVIQVKNSTGDAAVKLGFFGATPIVRQAHIADATTLSNVVSGFNTLLGYLENFGLLLTS
jgi:hypothetical protein